MTYIVYRKDTTRLVRKADGNEFFASQSSAKRHVTRFLNWDDYAVAEYADFLDNIEVRVERTNVMTGQKYMERINTPNYMSPASEAYWQM
jgi:uncharacterized protein YdbL (DUF1318 family)